MNIFKSMKWIDLSRFSIGIRWLFLFILSAIIIVILEFFKIPAAVLLGPMFAGIIIAMSNGEVKVKRVNFVLAQGTVGCMIAQVITTKIVVEVLSNWFLFIGGVVSVIIASNIIGYILAKRHILPGTTAIWGSSPGGASAMVLMAEAYGADERLVAVMQYLRVVLVAIIASILASIIAPKNLSLPEVNWFPHIEYTKFLITIVIAFGGSVGAKYLRVPAGGMLVPFIIAVVLQDLNVIELFLPPWFLALAYMVIGWTIGLRFTQTVLRYALKALPVLFLTTLFLIFLCALLGVLMTYLTGSDLLTSYMATSPGGADSMSIIAASTAVNMPFVMAFQTTRFIVVTLTGPLLSKFIANRLEVPQTRTKEHD